MKSAWSLLAALGLLLAPSAAQAQQSSDNCQVSERLTLADADSTSTQASSASADRPAKRASVTTPTPAVSVRPTTAAERRVQDVIETDGVHVVHFWAPWCPNSRRELENGWAALVSENPDVTFTFVTVWNDGQNGADMLDKYDLPDRVTEVAQPDLGPSDQESNRRRSFLTHPVTWIPSTWIFHNNGELAFAMNYGEMDRSTIQSLLDATRQDW